MIGGRRKAGERVKRLALVGVAVCAFLLGTEILLRAGGFRAEADVGVLRLADPRWRLVLDCYPSNPRGYFAVDLRSQPDRLRYHEVAPHRYDRVVARNPWAVEARFNSRRFREREPSPRVAGVTRVAVLGDSFTEGQGVKEADTTVRVLAGMLAARAPGRFEVLNCGRRAADFPALFDLFEEVLALEPDVLVYAMVLNDPERSAAFQARQRYVDDWILAREEGWDQPAAAESVLDLRFVAFVRRRLETLRIGRESTRWYLGLTGPDNPEGWERTKRYLREMNRRTRLRGSRFVLMLWPLLVDLEGKYPFQPVHDAIRRVGLESGIEQMDLLTVLRGRPSDSLWVHPVDRHPNELAHRVAAEALLPVLLDHEGSRARGPS